MILIGSIVIVAVIALAWFHGGEEPLRPITQAVPLPETQPVIPAEDGQ
ncbi:hypothetical protein [Pontixanthobacter sp.]